MKRLLTILLLVVCAISTNAQVKDVRSFTYTADPSVNDTLPLINTIDRLTTIGDILEMMNTPYPEGCELQENTFELRPDNAFSIDTVNFGPFTYLTYEYTMFHSPGIVQYIFFSSKSGIFDQSYWSRNVQYYDASLDKIYINRQQLPSGPFIDDTITVIQRVGVCGDSVFITEPTDGSKLWYLDDIITRNYPQGGGLEIRDQIKGSDWQFQMGGTAIGLDSAFTGLYLAAQNLATGLAGLFAMGDGSNLGQDVTAMVRALGDLSGGLPLFIETINIDTSDGGISRRMATDADGPISTVESYVSDTGNIEYEELHASTTEYDTSMRTVTVFSGLYGKSEMIFQASGADSSGNRLLNFRLQGKTDAAGTPFHKFTLEPRGLNAFEGVAPNFDAPSNWTIPLSLPPDNAYMVFDSSSRVWNFVVVDPTGGGLWEVVGLEGGPGVSAPVNSGLLRLKKTGTETDGIFQEMDWTVFDLPISHRAFRTYDGSPTGFGDSTDLFSFFRFNVVADTASPILFAYLGSWMTTGEYVTIDDTLWANDLQSYSVGGDLLIALDTISDNFFGILDNNYGHTGIRIWQDYNPDDTSLSNYLNFYLDSIQGDLDNSAMVIGRDERGKIAMRWGSGWGYLPGILPTDTILFLSPMNAHTDSLSRGAVPPPNTPYEGVSIPVQTRHGYGGVAMMPINAYNDTTLGYNYFLGSFFGESGTGISLRGYDKDNNERYNISYFGNKVPNTGTDSTTQTVWGLEYDSVLQYWYPFVKVQGDRGRNVSDTTVLASIGSRGRMIWLPYGGGSGGGSGPAGLWEDYNGQGIRPIDDSTLYFPNRIDGFYTRADNRADVDSMAQTNWSTADSLYLAQSPYFGLPFDASAGWDSLENIAVGDNRFVYKLVDPAASETDEYVLRAAKIDVSPIIQGSVLQSLQGTVFNFGDMDSVILNFGNVFGQTTGDSLKDVWWALYAIGNDTLLAQPNTVALDNVPYQVNQQYDFPLDAPFYQQLREGSTRATYQLFVDDFFQQPTMGFIDPEDSTSSFTFRPQDFGYFEVVLYASDSAEFTIDLVTMEFYFSSKAWDNEMVVRVDGFTGEVLTEDDNRRLGWKQELSTDVNGTTRRLLPADNYNQPGDIAIPALGQNITTGPCVLDMDSTSGYQEAFYDSSLATIFNMIQGVPVRSLDWGDRIVTDSIGNWNALDGQRMIVDSLPIIGDGTSVGIYSFAFDIPQDSSGCDCEIDTIRWHFFGNEIPTADTNSFQYHEISMFFHIGTDTWVTGSVEAQEAWPTSEQGWGLRNGNSTLSAAAFGSDGTMFGFNLSTFSPGSFNLLDADSAVLALIIPDSGWVRSDYVYLETLSDCSDPRSPKPTVLVTAEPDGTLGGTEYSAADVEVNEGWQIISTSGNDTLDMTQDWYIYDGLATNDTIYLAAGDASDLNEKVVKNASGNDVQIRGVAGVTINGDAAAIEIKSQLTGLWEGIRVKWLPKMSAWVRTD